MLFDKAIFLRRYLPDELYRLMEVLYLYLGNSYLLLKSR